MYDFSKKCFSSYILLTDQISLSDCLCFLKYWLIYILQLFVTSGLSRFWRHKFVNLRYLSNQAVFLHDQKVKTKTKILISWERNDKNSNILRTKRAFKAKEKSIFHHFLIAFFCQKLSQTWECAWPVYWLLLLQWHAAFVCMKFEFISGEILQKLSISFAWISGSCCRHIFLLPTVLYGEILLQARGK